MGWKVVAGGRGGRGGGAGLVYGHVAKKALNTSQAWPLF